MRSLCSLVGLDQSWPRRYQLRSAFTAVDVYSFWSIVVLFWKKLLGLHITTHVPCAFCPNILWHRWKASLWLLTGFTGLLSAETRFSQWKCGFLFFKKHLHFKNDLRFTRHGLPGRRLPRGSSLLVSMARGLQPQCLLVQKKVTIPLWHRYTR